MPTRAKPVNQGHAAFVAAWAARPAYGADGTRTARAEAPNLPQSLRGACVILEICEQRLEQHLLLDRQAV